MSRTSHIDFYIPESQLSKLENSGGQGGQGDVPFVLPRGKRRIAGRSFSGQGDVPFVLLGKLRSITPIS